MGLSEFIAKARRIHGDRFDYSQVIFAGNNTKVEIGCPVHGQFSQTPASHFLSKTGCVHCGREAVLAKCNSRLISQDEFECRVRVAHGDRYDLSKAKYVNRNLKVVLVCGIHGEFEALPDNLYRGKGCPSCSGNRRLSAEEFIERCKAVHGDKYLYNNTHYVSMTRHVRIQCRSHGEFRMLARCHARGYGCPCCVPDRMSEKFRMTTQEFVSKAQRVHGDRFDYSKTECGKNQKYPVKIICRKHGDFWQVTNHHLSGRGCPKCKSSVGELAIYSALEKLGLDYEPEKRFADCRNKNPMPFDAWIPSLRTLIEFDGPQHSSGWDIWKMVYREIKRRDEIKNEYAARNQYRLIRIPYKDRKRVYEILRSELGTHHSEKKKR